MGHGFHGYVKQPEGTCYNYYMFDWEKPSMISRCSIVMFDPSATDLFLDFDQLGIW
jgi:hypothetical protein